MWHRRHVEKYLSGHQAHQRGGVKPDSDVKIERNGGSNVVTVVIRRRQKCGIGEAKVNEIWGIK